MIRLLSLIAAIFLATPARAGLTVCNDAGLRAVVAIGYQKGNDWMSEGWWPMDPGQCVTVMQEELEYSKYYWRATTEAGAWPDESYMFCTSPEPFTIRGDTDCAARGFRREGFALFETGGAAEATLRLSAAEAPEARARDTAQTGETVTLSGRLNTCRIETDMLGITCEIEAGQERYLVEDTGPTDPEILGRLALLPDFSTLTARAQILFETEAGTVVALTALETGAADRFASLRRALQGDWIDAELGGVAIEVRGNTWFDMAFGQAFSDGRVDIRESCDGARRSPVLVIDYGSAAPGEVCWEIHDLTETDMHLQHVDDRSEFHYRKAGT